MIPLNYKLLTTETAAEYLIKVLLFLKKEGFNQKQVQERIGYNYLTKLKDHTTYGKETVGGKSRQDVLQLIVEGFDLEYDVSDDLFTLGEKEHLNKSTFYLIYLASLGYPVKVDKGLVEVSADNKVLVSLIDINTANDVSFVWKGLLEKTGSYFSFEIKRAGADSLPVKAHLAFYRGVSEISSVLLGTFAGISYDGEPTAGKAVLVKTDSKEIAEKQLDDDIPYQVEKYLRDQLNISKRVNVRNVDEIPCKLKLDDIAGEYFWYYHNSQREVKEGEFVINTNSIVTLNTYTRSFKGRIINQELSMMFIELNESKYDANYLDGKYRILANANIFNTIKAFNGLTLSSYAHHPVARHFLALKKDTYGNKSKEEIDEIVSSFFGAYDKTRIDTMSAYEFEKIILSNKAE